MSDILPEIDRLKRLLEVLPSVPSNHHKRGAGRIIAEQYSSVAGIENLFDAQASLYANIQALPDLITEQFPEAGRRAAALGCVDRLKEMFAPQNISIPFEQFLDATQVNRLFLSSTLLLLDDISFDSNALMGKSTEIIDSLDDLLKKVMSAEGLSHSSKLVVEAQIRLLERSVLRFSDSGVGPFRDSVFCSIGRIYVELKGNSNNDKVVTRDLLDDVLRVYGLMEAGGTLIGLGAPVALKLIGVG